MKRLIVALLLFPSLAWGWTYTANMDSYPSIGGGAYCYNRTAPNYGESITDSTTFDPSKSLHGYMVAGTNDGRESFHCAMPLPGGTTQLYFQYWFKFGNNWQWHPTIDKHFYVYANIGDNDRRVAGAVESRLRSSGAVNIQYASASIFGQGYRYVNVGTPISIQRGVWYKVTGWIDAGTPGSYNGRLKIWLNDTLQLDYTDVPFMASDSSYISEASLTPVWGGDSPDLTVPAGGMDIYFDKWIVSSEDTGGGATDTTPPYISSRDPSSGATGVAITDNTVARTWADAGDGVDADTMTITVGGTTYDCADTDNVACTGTAAARTITFTRGGNWDYGQTVSVGSYACDTAGNCASDNTVFTTAYQSAPTTKKTKAQLLEYLQGLSSLPSKKLMAGQRLSTLNTYVESDDREWDEISALTGGTVPAVAGFDFSCSPGETPCDYADGITRVVNHWNAGGIPYFTWHAANPTNNVWSWPIGDPAITLSDIYTPGNTRYDNFLIQLAAVGDAIALLEDNNVVILFAPLHEMNMSSDVFWWSGKSTTQLKAAWEYIRNYFEVTRSLSNIIWVYAGYPWESDVTTYYTALGDNNVDVIGFDYYSSNSRFSDSGIISRWNTLATVGKPMAFTELGLCSSSTHTDATCSNGDARTIVNDLSTYFPAAVWWMNWDEEDLDYGLNSMNYVPQALSDSRVIVLADNPSGSIASDTVAIQTTSLTEMRVGTAYSFSLTSVLGSTPYSYAVTAGTIPAGLVLSSSGAITGTPTTEGAYDFTVTVTDANTDTDDQQFTGTVLPKLPGGQVTTTSFTLTDTYVNSGAATTNYSDNAANRLYQWPIGTVANRTLVQVASLGLPDNISVTSATLYMYLSTWDGSGGTTPMNAYVYPVTGQSWTIANVTWNTLDNSAVGAYESVTQVPLTAGWYSWTVTEAAQAAYTAGGPLTLLVDGGQDGASDTNRYFTSMDGPEGLRPYLSVTYTQLTGGGVPVSAPGRFRISRAKAVVIK